jgi:hypothetical protein
MKRCPGCTLLVPNGTRACPDCGHKWEAPLPVETDGELVAYGTRDREDVSFDEQREAWDRLVEWAAAMHFKPGWCFFRFKERFGFSPVVVGDQLVDVRHANRDEKRAIYEGYLGVARTRGYRDGWAAYRYRDTFGVWPRFGASA